MTFGWCWCCVGPLGLEKNGWGEFRGLTPPGYCCVALSGLWFVGGGCDYPGACASVFFWLSHRLSCGQTLVPVATVRIEVGSAKDRVLLTVQDRSKSDPAVASAGAAPVAAGHPADPRIVVPTAAAENA